MQKILTTITMLLLMGILFVTPVSAQFIGVDPNDGDPRCATKELRERNPDICINIETINIPLFVNFTFIESFTIFSYIALGANLLFVGLTLIWIFLVVRAAIDYIQSQGSDDKIGTAKKRIQSIFASVSILFFSIVGLILVASFLGLGNFFTWPKKFSQCTDGTLYITKSIELAGNASSKLTEDQIDRACF